MNLKIFLYSHNDYAEQIQRVLESRLENKEKMLAMKRTLESQAATLLLQMKALDSEIQKYERGF